MRDMLIVESIWYKQKLVYALWKRWVINIVGTFTPNVPTWEHHHVLYKKELLDYACHHISFHINYRNHSKCNPYYVMKYDYLFGWPHPIIAVIIISSSVWLPFLSSHTHINCFLCFIVVFSVSTDDHQDACSWVIKIKSGAIDIQHSRKPTITLESSYRNHLGNQCNNSAGGLQLTTASRLCRTGF